MHQPKQYKSYVNAKNILEAHSSDESSLTDESFNNIEDIFFMFDELCYPCKTINNKKGELL